MDEFQVEKGAGGRAGAGVQIKQHYYQLASIRHTICGKFSVGSWHFQYISLGFPSKNEISHQIVLAFMEFSQPATNLRQNWYETKEKVKMSATLWTWQGGGWYSVCHDLTPSGFPSQATVSWTQFYFLRDIFFASQEQSLQLSSPNKQQ